MVMDMPREVIEEVAVITASAARMGGRVDWMDEVLGQISSKKKI